MSDQRKKTYAVGAMISATSLTEAWEIARKHLPANFTEEQSKLAAEADIRSFSIAETAKIVAADYSNYNSEETTA